MANREENMEKIRELKLAEQSRQIAAGDKFTVDMDIDFESATGTKYVGTLTFKRPSILETIRMGVNKAQLLKREMGDDVVPLELLNPEISYFAMVVGSLKVAILKSPEWLLDPEKVVDFDLLIHVYNRYDSWLDSFRKPSIAPPKGDSETSK